MAHLVCILAVVCCILQVSYSLMCKSGSDCSPIASCVSRSARRMKRTNVFHGQGVCQRMGTMNSACIPGSRPGRPPGMVGFPPCRMGMACRTNERMRQTQMASGRCMPMVMQDPMNTIARMPSQIANSVVNRGPSGYNMANNRPSANNMANSRLSARMNRPAANGMANSRQSARMNRPSAYGMANSRSSVRINRPAANGMANNRPQTNGRTNNRPIANSIRGQGQSGYGMQNNRPTANASPARMLMAMTKPCMGPNDCQLDECCCIMGSRAMGNAAAMALEVGVCNKMKKLGGKCIVKHGSGMAMHKLPEMCPCQLELECVGSKQYNMVHGEMGECRHPHPPCRRDSDCAPDDCCMFSYRYKKAAGMCKPMGAMGGRMCSQMQGLSYYLDVMRNFYPAG